MNARIFSDRPQGADLFKEIYCLRLCRIFGEARFLDSLPLLICVPFRSVPAGRVGTEDSKGFASDSDFRSSLHNQEERDVTTLESQLKRR